MKRRNLWIGLVVIMIAALGLSACGQEPTQEKIEPVELVDQGDGRNLVILTEKAAERLDIQTDTVREEQILLLSTYGGEVTETGSADEALVMVSLSSDQAVLVDPHGPAFVSLLDADDPEDSDEGEGLIAELDELPGLDDAEDNGVTKLYYSVKNTEAGLVTGQRLMVEISLKGDGGPQLVVPVAALLYDLNGETWIYISPEPLPFLRLPVVVDYIKDDMVILVAGPPVGTKVAIVGVAELHGADTGVGK